jgi:hypothetical protein
MLIKLKMFEVNFGLPESRMRLPEARSPGVALRKIFGSNTK